jgi:hypothetical protein
MLVKSGYLTISCSLFPLYSLFLSECGSYQHVACLSLTVFWGTYVLCGILLLLVNCSGVWDFTFLCARVCGDCV